MHLLGDAQMRRPQVLRRIVHKSHEGWIVIVLPVDWATFSPGGLRCLNSERLLRLTHRRLCELGDDLFAEVHHELIIQIIN